MPAPVLLSELKALLPSPTANECTAFAKALIALPARMYQLWSYIFDASGNTRAEFLQNTAAGTQVTLSTGMILWDAKISADEWDNGSGVKGRLECTGQAVSRTTYATLFAAIGEQYGVGDGSTTFNVPDLRARTMIGVGQGTDDQPTPTTRTIALGESDGEFDHKLTTGEMPTHNHPTVTTGSAGSDVASGSSYALGTTGDRGGDQVHNNMMPYLGLRAYIKT